MLNTYQHLFPQMAFAVSVGMVSGHDAISVILQYQKPYLLPPHDGTYQQR